MTPPHDLDAERAVLGGLLNGALRAEVGPVTPADFYRPAHALIHEAIEALAADGKPADPIAVADELRRRGDLQRMGGAVYLQTCMAAIPVTAQAGYYAGIVREHAVRRRVVQAAERIAQAAANPGEDLADVAAMVSGSSDTLAAGQNLESLLSRHSDGPDGSDGARYARLLAGVRDGAWLDRQQFPPLRYAVPGLIPEGLTLVIGAPKIGKSWLVLDLLLAASSGGLALGKIAAGQPRPVLYLALEDSDRRMQDRCQKLLGNGAQTPSLFSYQTRLESGALVDTIRGWLQRTPETSLVVIDTLGKVMPPAMQGESSYQRDYRIGSALKALADGHPGLAVVVNHHDRKASAEDFVDSVSGTHGLAGAADTIAVLARKRQATEGSLKITGRDVPENEYGLTIQDGMAWQLDGANLSAAAAEARRRDASRSLSDTSAQVLAAVQERPDGIYARDLVKRFGPDVYQYLKRLTEASRINKLSRGLYVPVSEPSGPSEPQLTDAADPDSGDADVRNGGWPEGSYGEEASQ